MVFNKLYITLRGEEDIRAIENTVKKYVLDRVDYAVWELLIGETAAELLESGAGELHILKETRLYKMLQAARKKRLKGTATTLFITNKVLKAVTELLLTRDEVHKGRWCGEFEALEFSLSHQVLSLPPVDIYSCYKEFLHSAGNLIRLFASGFDTARRTVIRTAFRTARWAAHRTAAAVKKIRLKLSGLFTRFVRTVLSMSVSLAKALLQFWTVVSSVRWKAAFQLVIIPILLLVIVGETSPVFYPDEDETEIRPSISLDATAELERVITQPLVTPESQEISLENGLKLLTSYRGRNSSIEGMGIYYFEDKNINFSNRIHLTFDDGPNLTILDKEREITVTDRILDILKQLHIKATFFINGNNLVDENGRPLPPARQVVDRMISEGHIIANHSFSHHNLSAGDYNDGKNDIKEIKEEITRTQTALDALLGYHYPMRYFRPPYAEAGRNEKVDQAVRELRMEMIIFQIDSFDYRLQSDKSYDEPTILNKMEEAIEDSTGGVVLLHDREKTAELLPDILRACSTTANEAGVFTQSTLYELLRIKYGLLKDF